MAGRAGAWFDERVARRLAGEPLQYVIGHWPFRSLDLMVDRRVLIPRPETEQIVEIALAELDRIIGDAPAVAVDLGTGSGAIALALVSERPNLTVWATDASPDALDVARANLAGLGGWAAPRVRLTQGDWWAALPDDLRGRVDLVVANPPYVTSAEMTGLAPVVAEWEPHLALEAGPDGLEDVSAVLAGAPGWLTPTGAAVVEIAPHQADAAGAAAAAAGFAAHEIRRDLVGRDRAIVARR